MRRSAQPASPSVSALTGSALSGWLLPLAALTGGLVGAGAMWGATQARPGGSVGPQVRAYLLSHPEVTEQAIQAMQDMQTGRIVARHRADIVPPYAGAWAGNPHGDVTVVEYFDYNCGYCRASLPTVTDLLRRDPKVRVTYRDLPILAQSSADAARVSLAAAAQGRFRAFHTALYNAGPVSAASIAAAARQAGVDATRLPDDIDVELGRNHATAAALGLQGTPMWVIGDRVLSGAQTLDTLEEAVKAARDRAG